MKTHSFYRYVSLLMVVALLLSPVTPAAARVPTAAAAPTVALAACPDQLVTSGADAGAGTLRQALIDICDGGTITFDPSNFIEVHLASTLIVDKQVTIGDGQAWASLYGGDTADDPSNVRLFRVEASGALTLTQVSLYNGYAAAAGSDPGYGGAVYNLGRLALEEVFFSDNWAEAGGALYNAGVVTGRYFEVYENTANGDGGGVYNAGQLRVDRLRASGNDAGGLGGGVYNAAGGVLAVAENGFIYGNSSELDGGGMANLGSLHLAQVEFYNQTSAASGGALHNATGGDLRLEDCTFESNSAALNGGAIDNAGSLWADVADIKSNWTDSDADGSGDGGGVYNGGSLTLLGSFLTYNQARNGGGLSNAAGATAQVDATVFRTNTAVQAGGGVANQGTLGMTGSSLSANQVVAEDDQTIPQGGGAYNTGSLTLKRGAVADNLLYLSEGATAYGAGLANYGNLVLENVSVLDNQVDPTAAPANPQGGGGGLYQGEDGAAPASVTRMSHVTLVGNNFIREPAVSQYSGIDLRAGWLHLTNSLLANNGAVQSAYYAAGFNNLYQGPGTGMAMYGGNVTNYAGPGCIFGPFDRCVPEAYLGGRGQYFPDYPYYPYVPPDLTIPGGGAGPAIDYARESGCTDVGRVDQGGYARPAVGAGLCDSGAYEPPATCSARITVQTGADAGVGSLRQAIADLCPYGTIDFADDFHLYSQGEYAITIPMTITGRTTPGVELIHSGGSGVFQVDAYDRVSMYDLDITNASNEEGAGAYINLSELWLEGINIREATGYSDDTYTYQGGAIYNGGQARLTFSGGSIRNSRGLGEPGEGAAIYNNGLLTVTHSTLADNYAEGFGGALANYGDARLESSTLSGNLATWDGGAVYNTGALTVTAGTLSGNTAGTPGMPPETRGSEGYGGAIYNGPYDGILRVKDRPAEQAGDAQSLSASRPQPGTGLPSTAAHVVIADSQLSGNTAYGDGGALFSFGSLSATGSTLSGNTALSTYSYKRRGGGVFAARYVGQATPVSPQLTLDRCRLENNTALYGGGLWLGGLPASLAATDFLTNTASYNGGGVYYDITQGGQIDHALIAGLPELRLAINGGAFEANTAGSSGGGLYLYGRTRLEGSRLAGNQALSYETGLGGAIANGFPESGGVLNGEYNLDLIGARLEANHSNFMGGGLANTIYTTQITRTLFISNSADEGGGLSAVGGQVILWDSGVQANQATYHGGGIHNGGATLEAVRTAIISNTVSGDALAAGAGVYNTAQMLLANVTLAGNRLLYPTPDASATYDGSALAQVGNASAYTQLVHTTISGNTAGYGSAAAVWIDQGGLQAANSVLAGNGDGPDDNLHINPAGSTLDSLGGNVTAGTSGAFNHASDRLVADAGLAGLWEYAPERYIVPLKGNSPALEAGLDEACQAAPVAALDQRGLVRPYPLGGACDSGAYESQGYQLNLQGGDNQHTLVTTWFTDALQVQVSANLPGEPLDGLQVRFAAPALGASVGLVGSPQAVDSSGQAAVTARANGVAGSYPVTATLDSPLPGPAQVIFHLTNDPATYHLAILGGDNQSAATNTAFASPLRVQVTSTPAGASLAGLQVVFTPPASGASAALNGGTTPLALTLDQNGAAQVSAAANGLTGSYLVTATLQGAAQANPASVSFHLTNLPSALQQTDLAVTALSARWDPALIGASNYLSLTVANHSTVAALGALVTYTLPAGTSLVSVADPACALAGADLVCHLGDLAAGASRTIPLRILLTAAIPDQTHLASQAVAASTLQDSHPADNTASLDFLAVIELLVYQLDDTPGSEWGANAHQATPACGAPFLGEFSNQTVTLSLPPLQEHFYTRTTFDLYILRSWDGNQRNNALPPELAGRPGLAVGPDYWRYAVDGKEMLSTTFSNWTYYNYYQAFPGRIGQSHPAQTGARSVNSHCYTFKGYDMDSVYALAGYLPQTGADLQLDFTAEGLQEITDESWGLGAVQVYIRALPLPALYLPVVK